MLRFVMAKEALATAMSHYSKGELLNFCLVIGKLDNDGLISLNSQFSTTSSSWSAISKTLAGLASSDWNRHILRHRRSTKTGMARPILERRISFGNLLLGFRERSKGYSIA